jgi:thermitase
MLIKGANLLNHRKYIVSTLIVLSLTVIVLGLWVLSIDPYKYEAPLPTLASLSNPVATQSVIEIQPTAIPTTVNLTDTPIVVPSIVPIEETVELDNKPIAGQHILEFADDMTADDISAYIETLDVKVLETLTELNRVVVLSESETIEYIQSEQIITTEPDYYASALLNLPPLDPYYPQQWNLAEIGAPVLWSALPSISNAVRIAVIDSGVCFDHPDMPTIYADFQYDYVENDNIPQDDYGHGCSVTGVIASQNNDIGIMGIAPFAEIMPLRVLNENGIGSYSNIARAIVDATNHGADVINLSLGGYQSSNTLKSAVDYALEQGVLLVGAAGNSRGDTPLYPARYDGVIAVGSINQAGQMSTFNHKGIELFAPGEDIIVPYINGDYRISSGTSLAAPHVTGVIALKLSIGQPFSPTDSILGTPPLVVEVDEAISSDPDEPLVFGDILIPREYAVDGDEANALFTFGSYGVFPWYNDIAYYEFDAGVSSLNRTRTREAMDQWEATSNIRFIPRNNESNYIYIQNSTGNSSYVGMMGGKQELYMASWSYKYIIVHELGHALGLWHEQTREDRDDYIFVDYDEIPSQWQSQFYKRSFAATVGDYDFASVMHYDAWAFAMNYPTPSIVVLPPNDAKWQYRIGETAYLSEWDAIGMWAAYPCDGNGIDCITLPENDIFEDAIEIDVESFSHSITGGYGTLIATTSTDDPFPSCAPFSAKGVWYEITIPASEITINTDGTNYDRALSIWTGGRGSYSEVACSQSGALTFNPNLGTIYYALVTGEYPLWSDFEADGGDLYFNFAAEPVCYPFDEWILLIDPPAPACAPNAPSSLDATVVLYDEQIDLDWVDNSPYETAFQIGRRISGTSTWSILGSVAGDVTTYNDTTVTCYTTYEYQVLAYRADDTMYSEPSNITTEQSSCSTVTPPSDLSLISALNSIQMDWVDNAPDETAFSVERSPHNTASWTEIATTAENVTTLIESAGLTCGSTYDYRVRAYRLGDDNYSTYSNVLDVTLTCDPPPAPSNVTVDAIVTLTDLQIGWQDNSADETSFVIERYVSGTWQPVTTIGANITSTQDTDPSLSCYTDYDYRVKAYRSHDGKQSSYASGTGETSCETLFTPDNLLVTNSLNTIVTTWDNHSPDGTDFEIERRISGTSTWSLLDTIDASLTTYSDNATICGYIYDYRVRQFRSNDSIYSTYSNEVSATQTCSPPTTPSSLMLEAIPLTRHITLSWLDNAFNETNYFVERSTDGASDWVEIASISADSVTYTDTDNTLTCYTPYFYRTRAYRSTDGVYSEYSNITSISTWCEPTLISTANFTDTSPTSNISDVLGFPIASCGMNIQYAHIWEYTPTETIQLSLNTSGSNFNTVLIVWRYDGAFTPITCNDDGTLDGTSASVTTVTAGQRYLVVVGGKNNASGSIDLNGIELLPPTAIPPPPDPPVPTATPLPNMTTIGLFDEGIWSFRDSNSKGASDITIRYGAQLDNSWQPVVGDWNGDGSDGIGLYKDGRWYLRDTTGNDVTAEYTFRFGTQESGWKPLAGDWNGDGIDGIGLYKDGTWLLKNQISAGDADYAFRFSGSGSSNAIPVVGDWHNQAVDRVGLYDNGIWFLSYDHQTSNKALIFSFGPANGEWYPIAGDWDEDGDDTIGIYKDGAWRLRNVNSRGSTDISFTFGGGNGVPLAGYRGGASALSLLAMPSDISLSEPEASPSPTVTQIPVEVTATSTLTPEPTVTLIPTSTVTPSPTVTWTPEPFPTETPTSEPPEIPNNTSGT